MKEPQEQGVRVLIRRLERARDLPLPARATPGSAGLDLRASVDEAVSLAPGERRLVPTGIEIALPPGFEGQVRPRSGLALREGLTLLNSPGTIDSDYRGEIAVILINLGERQVTVRRGDRIAQLVIQRVREASLHEVEELPETARGAGGFGHSG